MTIFPSLNGWWRCCQEGCGREVNPASWGEYCPDCSHTRCSSCEDLGGSSPGPKPPKPKPTPPELVSDCYVSPPAMTPPVRYHYRAKPRSLSMFINGALSSCCADSGSEVNCMTDTYARAIGAVVTNEIVLFYLPVRGRFLKSVGFAQLMCQFPTSPSMDQQVEFFVFEKLQCQVLFGRQFLRSTHTLDLYQHRLRVADSFPSVPLAVRSVGQVEERVHCWLDGEPVSLLADTGSDFNLIL
jgi:hypothetical protein